MFRSNRASVAGLTARLATMAVLTTIGSLLPATALAQSPAVQFTADGKARPPVGYRKWVFVGSPVTPQDMNGGNSAVSEFHSV